jgi:hypothetical protein
VVAQMVVAVSDHYVEGNPAEELCKIGMSRRGAPGLDPRSRRSLAVLKIVILCARFTRS